MFSFGGVVSGLDTESIIFQLMQLERAPIRAAQSRQAQLRKVDEAWGSVVTRLSSLQTAVDKVKSVGALSGMYSVTSSDESAVVATAGSGGQPGSLTFSVTALAAAHQTRSTGSFSSSSALVGAGSYAVDIGGTQTTISTTSSTTLADLAKQVDAIDGVSAQVVKVADNDHRLLVTSKDTGTGSAHTVTTDLTGLDTTELRAAADATIQLGSGAGAITVTRSSNTVSDLMEGVTLDLKKAGTGDITVTVAHDTDAAVDAITSMVDEVNATLDKLRELTKYDSASGAKGVLLGDSTARRLIGDIRMAVSDIVGGLGGTYNYAGSVGISLTRDGRVELDETKLREALQADPQAVSDLFSRAGSATGSVAYSSSTNTTTAGTYQVDITQIARVASLTGTAYVPPPTSPETFTITADDGTEVTVTVAVGSGIAGAVSAINNALLAQGINTIKASESTDGSGLPAIKLEETRYGSGIDFTVSANNVGLTSGTYAGQDVAGTIGGQAATGTGRSLKADAGDPKGLVVEVSAAATGNAGTVTLTSGIGDRLAKLVDGYTKTDGRIPNARASLTARIDDYDDQIASYEDRLALREQTIRRQFTAMESAMSGLIAQGNWLAAQLGTQMSS